MEGENPTETLNGYVRVLLTEKLIIANTHSNFRILQLYVQLRSSCFRFWLKPTLLTKARPSLMLKLFKSRLSGRKFSRVPNFALTCTNLPIWLKATMIHYTHGEQQWALVCFFIALATQNEDLGPFVRRISYGALDLKFWTLNSANTPHDSLRRFPDSEPFLFSWLISFLMITNYCFQYFHLFIGRVHRFILGFLPGLSTKRDCQRYYKRYCQRNKRHRKRHTFLWIVYHPLIPFWSCHHQQSLTSVNFSEHPAVIYLPYHLNYETVLAF